ncbi:hypothetical protein A2U01_0099244, partial [Trifolium medium]|nr:hypothetical protein [Trifolium medium]
PPILLYSHVRPIVPSSHPPSPDSSAIAEPAASAPAPQSSPSTVSPHIPSQVPSTSTLML